MTKAKTNKIIFTDIVILVVVAIALAVSCAFSRDIELALGLCYYVDAETGERVDPPKSVAHAEGAPSLNVHYVDVGQGDCTIIELPDGKTMIVDGGENNNSVKSHIKTFIQNTLPSGFEYFDYAILTHSDSDHCGSLDDVLNEYPARIFFRPNVEANRDGYTDPGKSDLTEDAATKNTLAYKNCIEAGYKANDSFTPRGLVTDPAKNYTISGGLGDNTYTFEFYTPLSETYNDSNDYSPIMLLDWRGYKFALSGDAEKKNEEEFVAKVSSAASDGVTDKYDVFTDEFCVSAIKAGHHGSRTSTSQGYLDAITTPEGAKNAYYIISCGENNEYGHPHAETLARLRAMDVPDSNILRTDVSGDITLSVERCDDGSYGLFYGDVKSSATPTAPLAPQNTTLPPEPGDSESQQPAPEPQSRETALVYKTLWGIELKWYVVCWSAYAILAVLILIHIAVTYFMYKSADKRGGRRK